jgi:hypothetical protein
MIQFKGHEVHEENNDYVEIILHIDTSPNGLVEFSKELGASDDEKEIHQAALAYVKRRVPKLRFKQIKVMLGGLLVATLLGTALVVPGSNNIAQAADAAVTGSPLAVDAITVGNFTAVVLNGRTQSTFATINGFNVSDPTGTGAGWSVSLAASQFTTGGTTPLTLPTGSLTLTAPTVALGDASSSPLTTVTASGGAIDTATGLKLLSAAVNGGMGTYTTSFAADSLKLNILPKDVKTGTYTSTITVTIASGP